MGNTVRSRQHKKRKATEGFYRAFYKRLIRNCTRNRTHLAFTLSLAEVLMLVKGNCYLCGKRPSNRFKSPHKDCYHGMEFKYSGLDRIDNAQGYHIWNVKPCCKECNALKSSKSLSEIKSHIRRIVKFGSLVKLGVSHADIRTKDQSKTGKGSGKKE